MELESNAAKLRETYLAPRLPVAMRTFGSKVMQAGVNSAETVSPSGGGCCQSSNYSNCGSSREGLFAVAARLVCLMNCCRQFLAMDKPVRD